MLRQNRASISKFELRLWRDYPWLKCVSDHSLPPKFKVVAIDVPQVHVIAQLCTLQQYLIYASSRCIKIDSLGLFMPMQNIRHTYIADEDLESLNWNVLGQRFELHNASGLHEVLYKTSCPEKLSSYGIYRIKLTSRAPTPLGDLLVSDALHGTSIVISTESERSIDATALKTYLGSQGLDLDLSRAINVNTDQILYLEHPMSSVAAFLDTQFPANAWKHSNIAFSEIIWTSDDTLQARTVGPICEAEEIEAADGITEVEIGMVQRQCRHLQDSEFKGLSAFLPADDFGIRLQMPD